MSATSAAPTSTSARTACAPGDLQTVGAALGRLPLPSNAPSVRELACPDCQSALQPAKLERATIHRCGSCAGTLLLRGELDKIQAAPEPPADEDPLLTRLLDAIAGAILPGG